jgi:chromate transporter
MNWLLLYLLFLKASLMSFGGMASLPIVRADFVLHYKALTDRELNTAVAAARVGPGPMGLYIVGVGYFVGGVSGAAAACLAMMTPAFLAIALLRMLGERASHPLTRRLIRTLSLAAAGLILSVNYPLAHDAISGVGPLLFALASFALVTFARLSTLPVMLGAGILSFVIFGLL